MAGADQSSAELPVTHTMQNVHLVTHFTLFKTHSDNVLLLACKNMCPLMWIERSRVGVFN